MEIGLLRRLQRRGVLGRDLARQRHHVPAQLAARHRVVDEAHLGRAPAVEGPAGQRVELVVAGAQKIAHRLRDAAAGKHLEVDLAEPHLRVLGGDGEVAGLDDGERAAEAVAVDHGDGRLGKEAQRAPAPFDRDPRRAVVGGRIVAQVHEEFLEVHAGAEGLAGARDHEHAAARVVAQPLERVGHLLAENRVHRVALFGPVERERRHPVVELHNYGLVVHRPLPPRNPLRNAGQSAVWTGSSQPACGAPTAVRSPMRQSRPIRVAVRRSGSRWFPRGGFALP